MHAQRKNNPQNKIKMKHLGQRGLLRCPGELTAGPPFPFAFQHSSFVKLPLHCQGKNWGGSQKGVSLFTFQQDSRATLKSYRSFLFVNTVKAENCFLFSSRALEQAHVQHDEEPAKLWALPPACFHQQHPTSAGRKANDKQMISK